MKVRNFLGILLFILSFQIIIVNSAEILSLENTNFFNYLYFNEDDNSSINKISYEVLYDQSIEGNLRFNLELDYKDIKKNICNYDILIDQNTIFRKITCEIPKLGSGIYLFKATLIKEARIIGALENSYEIKPIIIEVNNSDSEIIFENIIGNQTRITINIVENSSNLIVKNTIPKEVIPYLDNNNKDNLITTNSTYEILNPDPLIAWTVDNAPSKIEYTINKKIDKKDMGNFKLEIKKSKSFQSFKYIVILLLVIILILIFKPLLKKSRKNKR